MSRPRRILLAVAALMLPIIAGTTGSVSGMITDGAGAPVARAKVTITSTAMGTATSASTDRKGAYGFLTLQPGTYDLHAEAPGFAPADRHGLAVHVNSAIKVDLTLEPAR